MKGFKKCLSLSALFALSLIGSSVLFSTGVNASSIYDGIIDGYTEPATLDTTLYQGQGTGIRDFTYRGLIDYLQGASPTIGSNNVSVDGNCNLTGAQSWIGDAVADGQFVGFYTQNTETFPLVNQQLFVYRFADNPGDVIFKQQGSLTGGFLDTSTEMYTDDLAIINFQSFGDSLRFNCYTGYPIDNEFIIGTSSSGSVTILLHLQDFNIVYPTGYEGPGFPTFPSYGTPLNTYQPDIFMSSMKDFKGEFSDRTFLTFDGYPFLCGEFSPQLNVEVWKGHGGDDEELLDTLSTSSSSLFTYTFPTAYETTDYRIVSWYSCPEFIFTNVAFYDFQINSSGQLVNDIPCNAELFCDLNLPTYGLTQAILSPLAFIGQIPTNDCQPLVLPMPHGMTNITLPCMTPIYQTYFGSIFLLYQTILTGMFAYYVSLKLFGNVKDITNPRDDQVETAKL